MQPPYITKSFISKFLEDALNEDIGDGDHSTLACIPKDALGVAEIIAKDNGIIAGIELCQQLIEKYDPSLNLASFKKDGDAVHKGEVILNLSGSSRSILTIERLLLNCMQRMSGIATKTRNLVKQLEGTTAQLLDTRKTTPGFRLIEKWAVLIGGGSNHRIGLFDMIMLKDNHIDMAGGIKQAILRTKDYLRATGKRLRIEIETRNLKEVEEVIQTGEVDIIMLDNMSLVDMRSAVQLVNGRFKTEASGNINEKTIRQVAACGVDFISVGALTHSYQSLDLSLKIVNEK